MSMSRFAAISSATAAIALLAGCPGPIGINVAPDLSSRISCDQSRPYPPALNCGAARNENQVCVNFLANGCIDPNDPVTPSYVNVCPDDTIKWVSRGPGSGPRKFEIYFIPISVDRRNHKPAQEYDDDSHGPWLVRSAVPSGKDANNANIEYKYTVRGGPDSCSARVFDPRIKIDPQ